MFLLPIFVTICCISNAFAGSYVAPVFNLAPVYGSKSAAAPASSGAKTTSAAKPVAAAPVFVSSTGDSGLPASQVPVLAPVPSLTSAFLQNQLYNISIKDHLSNYFIKFY